MSRHNLRVSLLFLLPIFAICARAQTVQTDQQAYCAYLTEQAQAQRKLLGTSNGIGTITLSGDVLQQSR